MSYVGCPSSSPVGQTRLGLVMARGGHPPPIDWMHPKASEIFAQNNALFLHKSFSYFLERRHSLLPRLYFSAVLFQNSVFATKSSHIMKQTLIGTLWPCI